MCSKKSILCVPSRTFLALHAERSLRSKHDIPCVRSKTFVVFEARHSLCSKQNIPCIQNKHSSCSKQDIPCVRSKTFLVFEAGHSLCCEQDISCGPITKNALATFWWIRPIVPGFGRIIIRFAQIVGRFAKKWRAKFSNFKRLKNREDSSDFDNFWTESIAAT